MATKTAKDLTLLDSLADDVIVVIGDNTSGEYLRTNIGSLKTYFGAGGISINKAATKAAVPGNLSDCLVIVTADETNNGDKSLYLSSSGSLIFIQTIA